MCGRFVLNSSPEEIADHFSLAAPPKNLTPRFNIAPSQPVGVVALKADRVRRGMAFLKWGLVPYWSNDGKPGPINARAETVGGLPTFSDSFRERRCIIPASGFYEWMKVGAKKVPQHIRLTGGGPMGFAGLWSDWGSEAEGNRLTTCCIITTAANELVQPFHDRMPAILPPDAYGAWLDDDGDLKQLHGLLRPYPAHLMAVSAASPLVNSPKNEGPRLLEPAA